MHRNNKRQRTSPRLLPGEDPHSDFCEFESPERANSSMNEANRKDEMLLQNTDVPLESEKSPVQLLDGAA